MEKSIDADSIVALNGRQVPVFLRINRQAKRIILRVDPIRGGVQITAPSRRAAPDALAFARERATWIIDQLDEGAPARPFRAGETCPFLGESHQIFNEGGPRAPVRIVCRDKRRAMIVGGDAAHLNRRLVDWLKREAKQRLTKRVAEYASVLGCRPSRLAVRDTRSRWGSCNSDRALSFSWRLVLAPPFVLDYVAAHECTHLIHLNHSQRFWRTLSTLPVETEAAEHWLNIHGAGLHVWGVETTTPIAG